MLNGLWFVCEIVAELRWDWVDARLESKEKNKGSAAEIFAGPLSSFGKSVVSWCRKIRIKFHLLCLKLDS